MYSHQLWLIVKMAWPSVPWDVLKNPIPKILLTREAGRKSIDRIWMIRSDRLSWWEARAICVDSVAILRFTWEVLSVKFCKAGTVLTNFCVPLVDHCKAFANTYLGPLVVEIAIRANKLCFSQERVKCLSERCAQFCFILHRGSCCRSRDGCWSNIFLKPLILSFQMLDCTIKNVIVSGDLFDLSRKRKEDLYPLRIVTCWFQLPGFEFLIITYSGRSMRSRAKCQVRVRGKYLPIRTEGPKSLARNHTFSTEDS